MKDKKQRLLIEQLLASSDVYILCSGIIKSKYFDPEYRNTVSFIQTYYDQYSALPTVDIIKAETDLTLEQKPPLTTDQIKYCSEEVEKFCKNKAIEHAIIDGSMLIESGDYGKIVKLIDDAMMVSLKKDLGLMYFHNVRERLERMFHQQQTQRIPTLWREIDEVLEGGINRGEMMLFTASTGGGKSLSMINLALNLVKQGLCVVYITFELQQDPTSGRLDMMISCLKSSELHNHIDDIVDAVEGHLETHKGEFCLRYMNSRSTINDIRAFLKEFQLQTKLAIDAIVVDYLDIMDPTEHVSRDNVFQKDKLVSEDLRNLASDYNAAVITASQHNRDGIDLHEAKRSHIAGGISKANTTDVWIAVLLNENLKAAGEIGFKFMKLRNNDGIDKVLFLNYNRATMLISDKERQADFNVNTSFGTSKVSRLDRYRKPVDDESERQDNEDELYNFD